ncbi:SA1362 family protein [Bacillaceae bacterium IKA-2]|nr:SA1362 family protein [Bacillaceae bacterium IKA-2]
MTRYSFHPLILTVLGLSIIGLFYRLYTDPIGLISQVLFMVAFVAIIFFLAKKFLAHKLGTDANYSSQYQKAKRKNSRRTAASNVVPHKKKNDSKKMARPLIKKRSEVNLTVIEGKKTKKKNRALF